MNATVEKQISSRNGEKSFSARDREMPYEIIDGTELELPPMSEESASIANHLRDAITLHAAPKKLGRAFMDTLIQMPIEADRSRSRCPDLAYYTRETLPPNFKFSKKAALEVVPDLCVEVISPTDIAEDVEGKAIEYLEAGVRQVWVIYPSSKRIRMYHSPKQEAILTWGDTLTGGNLIPGFELPLSELFEPSQEP